ncbi:PilZ domain-containing protein [Lachnospiraceae bacterium C10]|jgi:hypothetical protein|nr:PilZ domain-containing protein [Lachnospiraceae bacterium C10]
MMIGELKQGSKIAITISGYRNKIFTGKTVKLSDSEMRAIQTLCKKYKFLSCIPVGLISDGHQNVSFPTKYTYNVAAECNGRMFLWSPVVIRRVKTASRGLINLLFCSVDTEAYNRRMEFRLPMDTLATANVSKDHSLHHIILKDISEHGFGLLVDQTAKVSIGDSLSICFMEEAYNNKKRVWELTRYEMTGQIVRLRTTSGNKYNIGCCVKHSDRQISSYIYGKQMQKARLSNSYRKSL